MKSLFLFFSFLIAMPFFSKTLAMRNVLEKKPTLLDFGAIGDGKTDDSAAFLKALEAVGKNQNKNLVIPGNFIFNLNNKTIDFGKFTPDILIEFEGGIIKNATLKGFKTRIKASRVKIFDNITLSGTFISVSDFAYPEWFGGFPNDNQIDLVDALRKLDPVFYDISLGIGDYFTEKGEYMVKGLSGISMARSRVIMETDRSNTYIFSLGKIGGQFKDRNYDYNYIKNVSLYVSKKSPSARLKGNRGIIIGAAHKPLVENVKVQQSESFQRFTKTDLQQFLTNQNKVNEANVGIEFRGDSEVSHLSNIFTLADVGILFSQYTDIVYISDYMNWCGQYGLANLYFRKEAVKSQNLLFTGTQSWNQGLYGFYSEDSNEWNTFRNNKFENIRMEQLTKEITENGKVASTSIRIGKSNLIANLIFENVILSGASNGIYIGETTSGNLYFDKVNLVPDITVKRAFAIKSKFLPPSSSNLETPFKLSLKAVDLFNDSDSFFDGAKKDVLNRNTATDKKNVFDNSVISY